MKLARKRLIELVRKLGALPIQKWKRHSKTKVEEVHPDSNCVGSTTEYTEYRTCLDRLNILLSKEHYSGSSSRITYGLEANVVRSDAYFANNEIDVTFRGIKGPIERLFDKVEIEYERNEELQSETREKRDRNYLVTALEQSLKVPSQKLTRHPKP